MYSFADIYKQQIEFNFSKSPYIKNFKKYPYSFVKSRYYIFFGTCLVYILQNTNILPNTVTKLYILFGVIAAFLLALPYEEAHYVALFMIFSKGILDWTDGQLARVKKKTSLTGHILDTYGALIHSISFIIALGIYQYYYLNNIWFLFALFIYPFCAGTLLTRFSYRYIYDDLSNDKYVAEISSKEKIEKNPITSKYKVYVNFFANFLDDRSRTIDIVCLIILLEHFDYPSLSWLFFVAVNIKWMILWLGSFYVSSSNNWADNMVVSKIKKIKDV